jgi:AcrR family transcriptional regulator
MIQAKMTPSPKVAARRTSAQTREHVLSVAHELFYWEGIHATGIDKIAAAAQVAPTTLYRLFASKDDLVGAYVQRAQRGYQEWLTTATAPSIGGPRERILALFDALAEQVRPPHYRGCPYQMALAEFPDPQSAAHANAVATKAWVRDHLAKLTDQLAEATPLNAPAALADQLALIVEGVYASVQALGDNGPARQARGAAEALLEAASRDRPATGGADRRRVSNPSSR